MLVRHSLAYLVARGIPGLINFASIAIYTRLLDPDEYGRYSLALSTVGFLGVILFEWLRLSLLRFWPTHRENPQPLLSTVRSGFVFLAGLVSIGGLLFAVFGSTSTWRGLVVLGVILVWCQGWFDLNLELARSNLSPTRYGMMVAARAIASLAFGVSAVRHGFGAGGPLAGLIVGSAVATYFWGVPEWKASRFRVRKDVLTEILAYGLPLSATLALSFVISASDRFVIAMYLGEEAAGLYAASYDFVNQILTMLMMVVGLAFGPLVIRAFEEHGLSALQEVVQQNVRLLLIVAIPVTTTFVVAGHELGATFLGPKFGDTTQVLVPLAAVSTFLAGFRTYHFDHAFRLGRWTMGQFWLSVPVAVVNLMLNVAFVPLMGIAGAALSTLISYTLALVLSVTCGRRAVRFSFPVGDSLRIVIAATLMGVVLNRLQVLSPELGLLLNLGVSGIVYVVGITISGVARRLFEFELG